MNDAFDPFNLILLAVAVVVIFKLRSVLGTRTGHEGGYDPFTPPPASEPKKRDDNVIPLPGHEDEHAGQDDADGREPIWAGHAEEGSDLAGGLEAIAAADPSFSPTEFLEGARIAYEMIVTAYAEDDKKGLKSLLTGDVYKGFAGAIDARAAEGQTLEYKFVGINSAELTAAALEKRKASVTVSFIAEMISATRDKTGAVIDGDDRQIREVTDTWTFERDVNSRDPNWKLSATEAAD